MIFVMLVCTVLILHHHHVVLREAYLAVFKEDLVLSITGLPIAGKPEYMIKHLRTHKMVNEDIKKWACDQKTAKEKQTTHPMPSTPSKSLLSRVTVVLVSH